ncbi:MAG: hypothetical protein GJ680_17385 [Alteromonadaceae bacterium]|nr:hypothetical protein [Alteromonadaceae bacterium]
MKVPIQIRVLIAIVASPTLMVLGFLFYNLVTFNFADIAISTGIFSLLGCFAYYIVITGNLPFKSSSPLD